MIALLDNTCFNANPGCLDFNSCFPLDLQSEKVGDDTRKAAACNIAEQSSLNFTTKHEDDGDAEEERLPHVVRPGHIRFEPLDEGTKFYFVEVSQHQSDYLVFMLPCACAFNGRI